jgi:protein-S-isoprenylcysteine O-methyltransferase Ste14
MKNLKLPYKIILANIVVALFFGLILSPMIGEQNFMGNFAFSFGLVCLGAGLLDIFLAFILLIEKSKDWSKGFFLSSAILLLLSGISCGSGAAL